MTKEKQCEHQWKNVSSKRQTVYQCELCGIYTFEQPAYAQTIKDQEAVIHRLQRRYAELEAKVGKPWIGLTEYDIDQIPYACSHADSRLIAYAIEAKLKEKNGI